MSHTFFHLCSPFHIMPQALKRRFTKASSEFSEIKLDSASLNEWSNCFHSDTQVRSTGGSTAQEVVPPTSNLWA